MEAIATAAHQLQERHAQVFHEQVLPELEKQNIHIVGWDDLDADAKTRLRQEFLRDIFPVLTPLAVDPAHPFPYISGLSLNLAVLVRNPQTGKELFARVKVPDQLDRMISVDGARAANTAGKESRYIPLETIIAEHLDTLFPGMEVVEHHVFRVTRNEDLEVEEDDAENLLQALEKELLRRRFGPPVRLEVEDTINPTILDLLISELNIDESEVYKLPAPLDLRGVGAIVRANRPPCTTPNTLPTLPAGSTPPKPLKKRTYSPQHVTTTCCCTTPTIRSPPVCRRSSPRPQPTRVCRQSSRPCTAPAATPPIVDALIEAAEAGKQVVALVEIKARFDEEANISWARKLERAGVHVVYGIVGLKTHCKLSLVVRREGNQLRRYAHIGTGNYHPSTARFYEDLGIITCDEQICEDVSRLFNQLSGYAPKTSYKSLLVAPRSLRSGLIECIEKEIENHKAGKEARIQIKCNSIVDEAIIDSLYRASQAGVPVDVVVRGICALRPGVPGLSENIRVRSVLGRFLEHSRVFAFANNGEPIVYIGSADMMHRNLDRRIEALVRIKDPRHIKYLLDMFTVYMSDESRTWHLDANGTWTRFNQDAEGNPLRDVQSHYLRSRSRKNVDKV